MTLTIKFIPLNPIIRISKYELLITSVSELQLQTEHENSHTGTTPFQCNVCLLRFTRRSTLYNHRRTHSKELPFFCSKCGRAFRWKNSLQCHYEVHRKNQKLDSSSEEKPLKLPKTASSELVITFDRMNINFIHDLLDSSFSSDSQKFWSATDNCFHGTLPEKYAVFHDRIELVNKEAPYVFLSEML
ncbi:unnamed protein product [Soboliphyme baturini]|uniref:C2H2-type domain-containing protein n=1 Tax=Soboliphyme baturini TaxID=241478 RepID=A0A183IKL5_9BILA|nr:unnamed protein product [Soboliphyme baturini]